MYFVSVLRLPKLEFAEIESAAEAVIVASDFTVTIIEWYSLPPAAIEV